MNRIKVNIFLVPGILILIALILQYIVNPKYIFPEPHPFKGEYLYNPYRGLDSTKWRIANFHAHVWKFPGKTSSTLKSYQSINDLYQYLGYSIIDISDYQRINTYQNKNEWFVPVYEHGYQYYKNHQLVLNAKKVNWLDYFFRQTLNNKQFIINQLKKDSTIVLTILHPNLRKAYSFDEFKYLSNYNCLEIANNKRLFTSYYDTILSSGHPVFLMADDDAHDPSKIDEVGHSFNLINTDLVKDSVLRAIKTGRSVGVKLNMDLIKTNEEKKAAFQKLPEITLITLKKDTLDVRLNKSVKTIRFIGQNGTVRKAITNCTMGTYTFSLSDTYIRTEIECPDSTIYFLNPVFRYDGARLEDYTPSYNFLKTWVSRSAVLLVLFIILMIRNHKKVNV